MTRDEILSALSEVARQLERRGDVGAGELTLEMRLVEDLRLDSLALLTLAVGVENRFRVRLDEEGVGSIQTVGQLVDTIARALPADGTDRRSEDA